ncbi:elongation factor 1-alpha C-terminal domain-related protein [Eubacterium oxidoreducens]|uniref:elongation factor 1-alpha C-terminal domain-related protein n=1 Tax=Eubacterium oxidoreducens TaxID=1732 RepID=UPI003BFA7342
MDVNTGEKKEATSLEKNEIAVCELQLADSIVVDTFAKHKTLGELILIDRITNMTSACGVVNQVYKDEAGVAATVIDREARSNWKGQRAITVELNDVGIVVLLYAKKDLDTSIFNSVGEIPHLTKR